MTYIDTPPWFSRSGSVIEAGHCWADHTALRLEWTHGPERAVLISCGVDDKTNADLAAWQRLGAGA